MEVLRGKYCKFCIISQAYGFFISKEQGTSQKKIQKK